VTRITKNAQSKSGVTNPSSPDIRCYQAQNAGAVATVPAGSVIHYISTQQINHPGPTQYYLAKVPTGMSALTWDGAGAVWFKFHTEVPTMDKNNQLTWPGQSGFRDTARRQSTANHSRWLCHDQRDHSEKHTEW